AAEWRLGELLEDEELGGADAKPGLGGPIGQPERPDQSPKRPDCLGGWAEVHGSPTQLAGATGVRRMREAQPPLHQWTRRSESGTRVRSSFPRQATSRSRYSPTSRSPEIIHRPAMTTAGTRSTPRPRASRCSSRINR